MQASITAANVMQTHATTRDAGQMSVVLGAVVRGSDAAMQSASRFFFQWNGQKIETRPKIDEVEHGNVDGLRLRYGVIFVCSSQPGYWVLTGRAVGGRHTAFSPRVAAGSGFSFARLDKRN
jgi:hypothetical protein